MQFIAVVTLVVAATSLLAVGTPSRIESDVNIAIAKGMIGDWATQWTYPQILGAANSHQLREQARRALTIAALKGTQSSDPEEEAIRGEDAAILKLMEESKPDADAIQRWAIANGKERLSSFLTAIKEGLGESTVTSSAARVAGSYFDGIRAPTAEGEVEVKKERGTTVEDMVNSATVIEEKKSTTTGRKRKIVATETLLQYAEKALVPEIDPRTISRLSDFLATSKGQPDSAEVVNAVRSFLVDLLQGRQENSQFHMINGTATTTPAYLSVMEGSPEADRTQVAMRLTEVAPDHSGMVTRDLFTTGEVLEGWASVTPLAILNQLEYGFYHDRRLRPPRVAMSNPSPSSQTVEGYKQGVVGNVLRWVTASVSWMQGNEGSSRGRRFDQSEGFKRVQAAISGDSNDNSGVLEADVLNALPQLPDYGYALCATSSTKAPTLAHYTRDGFSATTERPITTVTAIRGVLYPLPFPQTGKAWKQTLNDATRLVDWCGLYSNNAAAELLTPLSLVLVGTDAKLESIDLQFSILPHERVILDKLSEAPGKHEPTPLDAHIVRESKALMGHQVLWQRVPDGETFQRSKSFLGHAWDQHWRAVALAGGFIVFRMYTGYRYTSKKAAMRQHIYKSTSDLAEQQNK